MKNRLLALLKLAVSAALIVWLLTSGKLDFSVLLANPFSGYQVIVCLAILSNMLLQVVRWVWLLKANNIHISFRKAVEITCVSNFFGLALPGMLGGDLVRVYYTARAAADTKFEGVSTIIADRSISLYSLLWIGGFSSAWVLLTSHNGTDAFLYKIAAIIIILTAGSVVFLVLLWFLPVRPFKPVMPGGRFRDTLMATLWVYRSNGRLLARCLVISIIANALDTATYLFASRVMETPITMGQTFVIGPLVTFANVLPISPGGIGVAETASSVLLGQFGILTGAEIVLLIRIWGIILRLAGGLVFVLGKGTNFYKGHEK